MTISPIGEIKWEVPKTLTVSDQSTIISVKDAIDQEVFHTFSVEFPEVAAALALNKRKTEMAKANFRNAEIAKARAVEEQCEETRE